MYYFIRFLTSSAEGWFKDRPYTSKHCDISGNISLSVQSHRSCPGLSRSEAANSYLIHQGKRISSNIYKCLTYLMNQMTACLGNWLTMLHSVWLTIFPRHLRALLSLHRLTVLHWDGLANLSWHGGTLLSGNLRNKLKIRIINKGEN